MGRLKQKEKIDDLQGMGEEKADNISFDLFINNHMAEGVAEHV